MPVTIKPSPDKVGRNSDATVTSESALYRALGEKWDTDAIGFHKTSGPSHAGKHILHSSFTGLKTSGLAPIVPYGNGFVEGVIRAFQQDLHLTIRPDDVWLAILTQFSFYVNKHAEELRGQFVDHDGQLELEVKEMSKPFFEWDIAALCQEFTTLMQDKIVDQTINEWLLPIFSTTTDNDIAVNSMVMMATMKAYFKYAMVGGCGFPSVTLLGTPEDWQMILSRLDKFSQYGPEPATWSKLLRAVIQRFIATFYLPDSPELKDFWMKAIYSIGAAGSGLSVPYNGWLTAFMFWDEHGVLNKSKWHTVDANSLPPMEIDGETFPLVPFTQAGLPSGVVDVPVKVKSLDLGLEIDTVIVVGSMGVSVTEGMQGDSGSMVQPCSGWWMLENSRKEL